MTFNKAVSGTVFDMINAVYYDKPLIFIIWHDQCRSSRQAFDFDRGYTFYFIKAVSGTVFGMIDAFYHEKPLTFIGAIRFTSSRLYYFVLANQVDVSADTQISPSRLSWYM